MRGIRPLASMLKSKDFNLPQSSKDTTASVVGTGILRLDYMKANLSGERMCFDLTNLKLLSGHSLPRHHPARRSQKNISRSTLLSIWRSEIHTGDS